MTSINLEYIEEQQDFVGASLGRRPPRPCPQSFIDRADEVVVVDAPPEAGTADRGSTICRSFASARCC